MSTDTTTEVETFVSPKDLAEAWGTDPKSVRRFLRANTSNRAGKGGRWEISTADVEVLTKAWNGKAQSVKFKIADVEPTDEEEQAAVELEAELELDDIDEL